MTIQKLFFVGLLGIAVAGSVGAAPEKVEKTAANKLTVEQIVEKANKVAYYSGKDGRADVEMKIQDANGGIRQRRFTVLRMNLKGEDQRFYVYFKAPADVRKMAYLVWKHPGKDDDRWLWLPSLNLKKRIAPGDKRTSFVGSDFVYEDVSGRDIHADTHELVRETETQYVLKNVPRDPDSVRFSFYTVWIDKDTFMPRKAEYYDKNGKVYRRVESTKIKKIQGFPTVIESYAADLKAGTRTTNVFSRIKYNIKLKKRIFTERFLRRPPREVR